MKKGGKKYRGFTLIELMIVITIIVILSGMSIAGYSRFTQRQAAMGRCQKLRLRNEKKCSR